MSSAAKRSMRKTALSGPDKHAAILDAAVHVFAKNGFYNSKVSEIARVANVADGTIYLYFKNKEDILISVFEAVLDLVIERIREAMAKVDSPLDKLRAFLITHAELVQEEPELAAVIQVELRASSNFMKEYNNTKYKELLGLIQDVVIEGQKSGELRNDIHPGVVKRSIFGAIDESARHWVLSRNQYDLSASANKIAELFAAALKA